MTLFEKVAGFDTKSVSLLCILGELTTVSTCQE